MNEFGIPYMGSKATICKSIGMVFPPGEHFYDLFGGGFSITHFMLEHRLKDFKYFHFNEIRPGICELIKDAIKGKYSYDRFKPEWISKEEFHKRKDIDPYVKMVWSFGNEGNNYLFGEDIERYKRSMHNAIVFNELDEAAKEVLGMDKFKDGFSITDRRLLLRNRAKIFFNHKDRSKQEHRLQQLERLQQLQQLQRLERLQQLQQLQGLEQLERLNFYNTSYENVEIKLGAIVYCDIPYNNTCSYDGNKSFNRKNFLDWASTREFPVYISEYEINDPRLKQIFSIKKRSLRASDKTLVNKTEKIYANKPGVKAYYNYVIKNNFSKV